MHIFTVFALFCAAACAVKPPCRTFINDSSSPISDLDITDDGIYDYVPENDVEFDERQCMHFVDPTDEIGYAVLNVEDADKMRRPWRYQRDTVAEQYIQRHKPATKAVVIVGGILILITTGSVAFACCRNTKKDLVPI
ncbi:hypothetical protein BaOVIS_026040 [Babesia ovis]|uniref:Uncharacterized protein n=1 Tax=Babesia ovis TaxID=5869 RepID=A0A9W5WVL8_BABOV|nr:hypothetical protein BaOVIS_026040 [Babesia ovis]